MVGKYENENEKINVRVCCRIRPKNQLEKEKENEQEGNISFECTDSTININTMDGICNFTFDKIFTDTSTQQDVFEYIAKPVVQDIMSGYNATVLAYGQTASGKTYTMEGSSLEDPLTKGMIPRIVTELFHSIETSDENIEFIIKVTYIEIYMEKIRDLLIQDTNKTNNNIKSMNLPIREDPKKGIYVSGVTEISVTNENELLNILREGRNNRAVAATGMNEGSSRSHSVFIITVLQRDILTFASKIGKLYLVDLAGSEMIRKTGASGQQLEEAKTINKSLSALGQVINALADSNISHIPYRDSKLTRVLQESLGGNARTVLIINISNSLYNLSETLSTLRFGTRAKKIKNNAIINEDKSIQEYKILLENTEKLINKQKNYIDTLENQLMDYKNKQIDPITVDLNDHNNIVTLPPPPSTFTTPPPSIITTNNNNNNNNKDNDKENDTKIYNQLIESNEILNKNRIHLENKLLNKKNKIKNIINEIQLLKNIINEKNEIISFQKEEYDQKIIDILNNHNISSNNIQNRIQEKEVIDLNQIQILNKDDINNNIKDTNTNNNNNNNNNNLNHIKNIQDKLEQLVYIHRELLKRYHINEIELISNYKKIDLKDERIKQLEINNKQLAEQLKNQSDTFIYENNLLNEEIEKLSIIQKTNKISYDTSNNNIINDKIIKRNIISSSSSSSSFTSSPIVRRIRGGKGQPIALIRPIRGGTNYINSNDSNDNYDYMENINQGFLSKIFNRNN